MSESACGRYVDAAMRWGAAHGVGVMIDIHAAPGSQNGCAGGLSLRQMMLMRCSLPSLRAQARLAPGPHDSRCPRGFRSFGWPAAFPCRFDHSAPEKQEQRSWDAKRLLGRDNAADTVALVAALAARYATAPALLGFFLLNEPTVWKLLSRP